MCAGLNAAISILEQWCREHPSAFPPTVLHVTDGHPSDGNPGADRGSLKNIATNDGSCLLFNLHLDVGAGEPLVFPNDERVIKDRFGKALFRMSSLLPPHAIEAAASKGLRRCAPAPAGSSTTPASRPSRTFSISATRPSVAADR